MSDQMTQSEVEARIEGLDDDQARKVVCALVGHSRIVGIWFGYYSCARCKARIGDKLGGSYDDSDDVIVGHQCQKCMDNYTKLGWRDLMFAPDPFVNTALTVKPREDK